MSLSDPLRAIRPGVALGPYPERDEPSVSWVERTGIRLAGRLQRTTTARVARFDEISTLAARHGPSLTAATDADLQVAVRELRDRLRAEPLSAPLAARAFAVVRELSDRVLGLRHFDVQLTGGWVMLNGMLAEMETGEGKTLTATLAACTAGLAGVPVHIITVNDYLAARDAAQMTPLYEALGLRVGLITEEMEADARRSAYTCDITYCTNKMVAFDYLRDRLVLGGQTGHLRLGLERLYESEPRVDQLLLRGLYFAIVDEADSVLIDEARTPLIISRPGAATDQTRIYTQALSIAMQLEGELHFFVNAREHLVELTEGGVERIDDIAGPLGGVWTGRRRREELVSQALVALHAYQLDRHYLVRDGKVQIIDEYTGRVMPDRSWERGLHQLIEAKEGCEITGHRETLARISYQRFFRRYLHVGGMSGTLHEVTPELWSVYRLHAVTIPTNRPVRRHAHPDRVFVTARAKWAAVVERVRTVHAEGRPLLVGTRSVGASEHLSELLTEAGLQHEVLNARQHGQEAEIIADAGQPAHITVATNMAGRGTDIRLAPGIEARGGLHVIATERHDAGRIDRQLFGRCARQGDRGSHEAIVSIEDELVALYFPRLLLAMISRSSDQLRPISDLLGRLIAKLSQSAAEREHARTRRELLKLDEQLAKMLAFSGRSE